MNLDKEFRKKDKEYKNTEHIIKITKSKGASQPAVYIQSDTYGVCVALGMFIKTLVLSGSVNPELIRHIVETTFKFCEEHGKHESK